MRGRRVWGTALVMALAGALVGTLAAPSAAQSENAESSAAQELAERYAPVVMLKEQEDECDSYGEPYMPMSVDALLDNEQIALRLVGNGDPVVKWGPSAEDIATLGQGFYLDFPGASLTPGCVFERDFRRFNERRRPTVYAHIARQRGERDRLALQYWFYWYYNDWNNKHESDWEFIQILFPASSVEEALEVEPIGVGYAQHEGGERAAWDDEKLERVGDHPVVYPSAGSHASYFGSALFLGRSGSEGFGCDNTDGPSRRIRPQVELLPDTVTDAGDPQAWLLFAGRWGERHDGPFNGPDGPYRKGRWTEPVDWHDGLRTSSFVVPTGDAQATQLVKAFCGAVEWGSVQYIQLLTSPGRAVLSLVVLGALVFALVRSTSWSRVAPLPVRWRRRGGEIARATVHVYGRRPLAFVVAGLVYLPLAAVAATLAGLAGAAPFVGDVISASTDGGGFARSIASALVGSFASLAALTIVIAAVSTMVQDISDGAGTSARLAFRRVAARSADLIGGLVRGYGIVILLLVSIVGAPWGVRQLVRYQLLPQAVMLDGLRGKDALERSSRLVRGRWWHTLLFVGLVYSALALGGFIVGLLLLVTLTSLPLWLLSVGVTLVTALLIPLGAIALTLLYGDARAERDELDERAVGDVADEVVSEVPAAAAGPTMDG